MFKYLLTISIVCFLYGCTKECDNKHDDLYKEKCSCDEYSTVGKFIGNYDGIVKEYKNSTFQYDFDFKCTIAKNAKALYTIDIFSDWNIGGAILRNAADVSQNTFKFVNPAFSGYTLTGSGFIEGNVIQMNYHLDEKGSSDYYDYLVIISK